MEKKRRSRKSAQATLVGHVTMCSRCRIDPLLWKQRDESCFAEQKQQLQDIVQVDRRTSTAMVSR
jgi:hypothetical protein